MEPTTLIIEIARRVAFDEMPDRIVPTLLRNHLHSRGDQGEQIRNLRARSGAQYRNS